MRTAAHGIKDVTEVRFDPCVKVGWATFVGLGVMLMLVPATGESHCPNAMGMLHYLFLTSLFMADELFNLPLPSGFLAAKLGSYRKELMGWTDKRVGLMSEIINGIQMIKFYAWEGKSSANSVPSFWKGPFTSQLHMLSSP